MDGTAELHETHDIHDTMYCPVPPRSERGMSAVDTPFGQRIAYCDTYEHAQVVAWALNVLAYQQGWLSLAELHVVLGDRCPICHYPTDWDGPADGGRQHHCINCGWGTPEGVQAPAQWGIVP
jgi:hypothetical protein